MSSSVSQIIASIFELPHISKLGLSPLQKAGRSGLPKIAHRLSFVSWMHRIPLGLPCGIPGNGLLMEGAMQQAPQSLLHCINS